MSQALWQALELLMGWDKILPFNNLTTYRKKKISIHASICRAITTKYVSTVTGLGSGKMLQGPTELIYSDKSRRASQRWWNWSPEGWVCFLRQFLNGASVKSQSWSANQATFICVWDWVTFPREISGWGVDCIFFFFNLTQVEREVSYFSQYFWFWFSMNISF